MRNFLFFSYMLWQVFFSEHSSFQQFFFFVVAFLLLLRLPRIPHTRLVYVQNGVIVLHYHPACRAF